MLIGLTDWASSNGIDELKLMKRQGFMKSTMRSLEFEDVRCFSWNIFSFLKSNGVTKDGIGSKNTDKK